MSKHQQIINAINEAYDHIVDEGTHEAALNLAHVISTRLGADCVWWEDLDLGIDGEALVLGIAFCETEIAAKVVIHPIGRVELLTGGGCPTTFGRYLLQEALWALEEGVATPDVIAALA